MTWKTHTQIDWDAWRPDHEATLAFLIHNDEVLLIRKKRGLGAGLITGPGGKLDPGETPRDCVLREVHEELQVNLHNPQARGRVDFQFTDGYALRVHVFVATAHDGAPTETPEAVPLWFPMGRIPYQDMWADDILWLPQVLNGGTVKARFLFQKTQLIDGLVLP